MEGSANDVNNKDFYSKLFQLTNVSVAGPYVNNCSRTKYGRKTYFEKFQHFMGDDAINRSKDKDYLETEAANYRGELQHFTYKTYALIFENNIHILSRNNNEMQDARLV